jgi:SAM-dependent methyltransferase
MDETTSAVRRMYEQYPYPSGNPTNRVGSDAQLVLSYVKSRRQGSGPLRVLDAGCGRGLGIIGAATLQPDVHFHGIDLNRVALEEARAAAKTRGLSNVTFQECDLMALEGLEVPPGGYDVIHSSGVLHHLSDPETGLSSLRDVLAPHGVINLMVYALHGRQPLINTAEAVALLFKQDEPLDQRVFPAREVAALARDNFLAGTTFENTSQVDDVELVDRLLNVNETSYNIPMMWDLLSRVGLRFIRWIEPADWDIERLLPECQLRQRLSALPPADQFRFIELVYHRPGFELIIAHGDNEPCAEPAPEELERCRFRLSPEVGIGTETRHSPQGVRIMDLTFKVRVREPVKVPGGAFAGIIMYLKDKPGELRGKDLLRHLEKMGVGAPDNQAVLLELLRQEVLFRVG